MLGSLCARQSDHVSSWHSSNWTTYQAGDFDGDGDSDAYEYYRDVRRS